MAIVGATLHAKAICVITVLDGGVSQLMLVDLITCMYVLSVPLIFPVCAVTFIDMGPDACGARVIEVGLQSEGVTKSLVSESTASEKKVVLLQALLSLFVSMHVYVTFPPLLVIACEVGEQLKVGGFCEQILIVVVTVLEVWGT